MSDNVWNVSDEWKWISIIPNTLVREVSVSVIQSGQLVTLSELSVVIFSFESSPFYLFAP